MTCNQPSVEFQFETREEYEKAIARLLGPEQAGGSPSRAVMAKVDLEEYDQLVDEYLKFCETNGE